MTTTDNIAKTPEAAATQITPPIAALQTYEDCLTALSTAENDTDLGNVKATLRKVKSFFETRVSKKKNTSAEAGFNATKNAIETNRRFKKYEPATLEATPTKSLF